MYFGFAALKPHPHFLYQEFILFLSFNDSDFSFSNNAMYDLAMMPKIN
jgi:hypothetical protein